MVHITDFDQVILNIPYCCSFVVDEMTHSVADFSSKVVGLREKKLNSKQIKSMTFNSSMIFQYKTEMYFYLALIFLHPSILQSDQPHLRFQQTCT